MVSSLVRCCCKLSATSRQHSRIAPGTVRDYFDDFKVILHISAFRKVVEQVPPPPQTKAVCRVPARNLFVVLNDVASGP